MNKMMKDFINHLFDIGILGVNSIKLFLNFYDKQKQSTFKVKELLAKILYDYFANLDNNGLENLCFEIISKFAESKSLDTTKVTKKLLNLYFKNQNNHLISCFYLWKKESIKGKILTRNNNSNLLKFGKTQSISKKFLNSFQNMYNGTLSSREIKEENEFRDCTFKPKINENYEFKSSNRNTLDTFDRLYSDYEKLQIKKISNKIELEEKENKKMTFSPSILTRDKSFKNTSRDPFLNRQEQYLKNLSEKKTITFKTSDEEKLENECTFSPKIYSKILIDQPASYRLYQDNTKRLKNLKALHKIRELGEKMRSLSSDKNNYCSINIEEMYSNYKNKTHKITELREKQDKEQGLTFNPRFYKNPNIKISSSFLERNYLNKKKTFEKDKSYITTPKVKTVSNREYEEIEKGIIERLYTKEIEKITERNKSEDKEKINNISSTKFNNKSKLDKSILSNSKKDNKTNTVKNDRTRKNNINN